MFWKIMLVAAVMWIAAPGAEAQTARILRFEPSVIEIDTVRYDAGLVKVRFVCTNICDKDVVIVDVHSQCGCAKPSFYRAAIKPGAQGFVEVELNPAHLFAEQNRHLTVVATNGDYRKFNTITIHGYVDRDITEEEVRYPYELSAGLRSDVQVLGMRLSKRGEVSEKEFTLYNASDSSLILGWKPADCGGNIHRVFVWVDVPFLLAPRKSARVRVWVDTRNLPAGVYEMPLILYAGGQPAVVILKGAVSEKL